VTAPIRIVIADDHPLLRDGLIAVLSPQPDFDVIGEAGDGAEAIQKVMALRPDVVLLDLAMPAMDGVEVLAHLRVSCPAIPVIVFTAFDTDERILGAIQAGARGYLLKGAPRDQVFDAVRVVHRGESLLQPVVASKLLRQMSRAREATDTSGALTPRELDVLRLLAQGLQNKEIADNLCLTERTIKFHVTSILTKLQAGNRTQAVTMAVQRGLIDL
jgi:DNA-binding NarL/FixJ family response regulator